MDSIINNFSIYLGENDINNESILINVIIVSLMGLIVFFLHSFYMNQYLRHKNYLLISMSLPLITLLITISISQNFYLALGMIGALSIVRFRTPVRNPYDLILYFFLITLGITIGVKFEYALILFLFMLILPIFINRFSLIVEKYSNKKIQMNNNSDSSLYKKDKIELQVVIDGSSIENLENKWYFENISLITFDKNKDQSEYSLNFIFNNFESAHKCQKEIDEVANIKSSSIL